MSWGRSTPVAIAFTAVAAVYALLMFSAENSEPEMPPSKTPIEAPSDQSQRPDQEADG